MVGHGGHGFHKKKQHWERKDCLVHVVLLASCADVLFASARPLLLRFLRRFPGWPLMLQAAAPTQPWLPQVRPGSLSIPSRSICAAPSAAAARLPSFS